MPDFKDHFTVRPGLSGHGTTRETEKVLINKIEKFTVYIAANCLDFSVKIKRQHNHNNVMYHKIETVRRLPQPPLVVCNSRAVLCGGKCQWEPKTQLSVTYRDLCTNMWSAGMLPQMTACTNF